MLFGVRLNAIGRDNDHDRPTMTFVCLVVPSTGERLAWTGLDLVASSQAFNVKVKGGCNSLVGVSQVACALAPDRKDQTDEARKQEGDDPRPSSTFGAIREKDADTETETHTQTDRQREGSSSCSQIWGAQVGLRALVD